MTSSPVPPIEPPDPSTINRGAGVDGTVGAFELLREQLDEVKNWMSERVASAMQADNYDHAHTLIEKAQRVGTIMEKADALLVEFDGLIDETPAPAPEPKPPTIPPVTEPVPPRHGDIRLVLKNKVCDARATYDRGYVTLLRGSRLARNERESMPDVWKELRRDLRRRGVLAIDESSRELVLRGDWPFKSPSGASFVVGYSANGRLVWTVEDTGESLGNRLNAGHG